MVTSTQRIPEKVSLTSAVESLVTLVVAHSQYNSTCWVSRCSKEMSTERNGSALLLEACQNVLSNSHLFTYYPADAVAIVLLINNRNPLSTVLED